MKKIITVSLILMLALSLAACGKGDDNGGTGGGTENALENTVFSADDLPGKKIGVQLGTTGDIYASDYEEEGSTIERYTKGADAVLALKQGKIDCVIIDDEPAKVFVSQNDDLRILDEPFETEEYAIAMKKDSELKEKIDAALQELMDDGTLDQIKSNYIGDNAGNSPYVSPEGITRDNGTLTVATNAEFPPYEYVAGGNIVGLDIDIAQAICDKLGMELVVENMNFDSILAAINSGKADVGIAGMTATDERKQSVDFSIPYTTATQVIIVRK